MRKTLTRKADGVAIQGEEDLQRMPGESSSQEEVSTSGDAPVIAPMSDDERRRKFERSMERINKKYAGLFRRLAKS